MLKKKKIIDKKKTYFIIHIRTKTKRKKHELIKLIN